MKHPLVARHWQRAKPYYPLWWPLLAALCRAYWVCLPSPLFATPYSHVLEDREGRLMGARIAADGQWRFPLIEAVPDKFAAAITCFEDRRFYYHPGIDPLSLARALGQNLRAGRVVSGGSTLSMQVARLARGQAPRHLWSKVVEAIWATRLEWRYGKRDILRFYASQAPFGGNVVGLEAACWRYFGKSPQLLSWAEAATLAVLPNSPALIHPGRNRAALLRKRNALLARLLAAGQLDSLSYELALEEALPAAPRPLPQLAPQLLDRSILEAGAPRCRSTLEAALQEKTLRVAARHERRLQALGVHNLAVLVLDVRRNEVLAYVGNAPGAAGSHQGSVDIIPAPRSTGSIMKPWLYALMLESGDILPHSLQSDVPTQIKSYRPVNFHEQYDGMVPASRAIVRSLNVPLVHMLAAYGQPKFHQRLRHWGLGHITRPAAHYGLSLILGGAEASLWDVAATYASMARVLNGFSARDGRYAAADFAKPNYRLLAGAENGEGRLLREAPHLAAAPIWQMFETMRQVERPDSEGRWERFSSARRVAWKTGTSFGFRDAWAVGATPEYVVAVWAGNADGEGRPGLLGVEAAAPLLFDVYQLLPATTWFEQPYDEMRAVAVCPQSGYRALPQCGVADTLWAYEQGLRARACPYHQVLYVDAAGEWQVHADCADFSAMRAESYFVLPPLEEFYYKNQHPEHRAPPPFRPDCQGTDAGGPPMSMIYPRAYAKIYLPVGMDGEQRKAVFSLAHRRPGTVVYWHLDDSYLGHTQTFHEMALQPAPGPHRLTLVDAEGHRLEQAFEVLAAERR